MPWIGPRSTPRTGALARTFPAEVDDVCEPWPFESRAVWYGSAAARPGFDRYVARNGAQVPYHNGRP